MKQTTKNKVAKTLALLAFPAIVLYVILAFLFIQFEPKKFETVPNDCGSLCYDYIIGENSWGEKTIIDMVREPETIQQEVDYMGIGDYMLIIPLRLFLVGFLGLTLFIIVLWGYHSIKKIGQEISKTWKS